MPGRAWSEVERLVREAERSGGMVGVTAMRATGILYGLGAGVT